MTKKDQLMKHDSREYIRLVPDMLCVRPRRYSRL